MQRLALPTFLMLALSCHTEITAAPNGHLLLRAGKSLQAIINRTILGNASFGPPPVSLRCEKPRQTQLSNRDESKKNKAVFEVYGLNTLSDLFPPDTR
jgi:hypothetical protein